MLRAAAVFSDHMVLQRERPILIFGEADAPVTATLAGHEALAVPAGGRFRVALPAMPAGGPHVLALSCGGERAVFRDVMIGEVWLCGGQSNMEFVLRNGKGGAAEAAAADDGLLRFYTVNEEADVDAAMLRRERRTSWKLLSPGACGDVSAVAYYAGRRLRAALGVPVGMLVCCVGGTEIAHWISRETLATLPEGRAALDAFERAIAGVDDAEFRRENAAYAARVEAWCAAEAALRREKPDIRANALAAAIGDFPWPPPTGAGMMRRPGNLWRTMTRRITPYGAKGLLWYQGESDAYKAGDYEVLFAALIAEWRRGFENDNMFVVAAQLPNFGADPAQEDWPGIRQAQRRVCETDGNGALACLLDCGESDDIHPWDKRLPGLRMANLALKHVYGMDVPADAPVLMTVSPAEGGVRLRFTEPLAALRGDARSLTADGLPVAARVENGELFIKTAGAAKLAYAWENDPAACLFGESGLPAFPFKAALPGAQEA